MNIEYEENEEEIRKTNQRIGEVIVSMGLISQEELEDALVEQEILRRDGEEIMIGYLLIEMDLIKNIDLIEVYREYKRRLKECQRKKRKNL
ncbi:MAG: hypothetical protein Unbinned6242contig1001_5 [Prokaryotic dsDNA virus sp.]|nr:MAG: hypothetical protein Unbinned6242contig1001_5 [Prokaryotic dsDNA virus sp.]|tara:strand:+ start:13514 stop:13786 length:273 start_codon:yes stop_codon:yes gene_type:complete